jgi:hypothetical protein
LYNSVSMFTSDTLIGPQNFLKGPSNHR